ncbi:MAG: DNA repair protein RecN [Phycisphaerae bacterium]|nr:DNA repair protein RecN [Tepidisphaeraceae bacterium]
MLRELHISNLAVIADARIELHAGLNCFTGATGAGKSLVIGAVEVLLGLRSPAEMLRGGVDEGRVSGVFEIKDAEALKAIERVTDVPVTQEGGELLLTRRLYASGRSSVSLNGNPITLGMLKQVAENLIDVHGQHDHQFLLKPANQVDVLDQFGNLWPLRQQYREVYDRLQAAKARLEELSTNRTLREQQLELYRFQAQEIDNTELSADEYAELETRSSVLRNLEKIKKDAGGVHTALYEADGAVLERLKMMAAVLAELATLDPNVVPIAKSVKEATIGLEEAAFDLSRYLDKLDLDPGELAEVEDRLNTLNRVLNKYEDTVEATLAYRADIGKKIHDLEHASEDLSSLNKEIAPLTKRLTELGTELSAKRQAAAKQLFPRVERALAELGMEKARFQVSFAAPGAAPQHSPLSTQDSTARATASGFDHLEFLAQTNPGQPPQPLRKIASGGEMSRIMLALKGILASSDRVSVLVFDEIDANVGGRLGAIIGTKLQELASSHQVLCITHLPQIACYADRHLTVRKDVAAGKTTTTVRTMEGDERLQEIAEMIGGQRITDTTRAQARELLDAAKEEGLKARARYATAKRDAEARAEARKDEPKREARPARKKAAG